MILGGYILTAVGLNLKFSGPVMEYDDGPFKWYTAPMVDLGTYELKIKNHRKLHLNNHLPILKKKK